MNTIFNGKLCEGRTVDFSPDNRGFCYGDGLFETMIVRRGTCPLLSYHLKRLFQGLGLLQINVPFNQKELEGYIWQLATQYNVPLVRMRLQVWRKAGGLYAPEQKDAEFLLSAVPFVKPDWIKQKVAFAETVKLHHSSYSSLKTMSALPYVLAGLEMKSRQLDDVILTDENGHVAECSSSNLFWLKDNCWQTPHLESGCVAGVMRAYLLDQLRQKQIPVQEVLLPKERLLDAEVLISCNVAGLFSIRNVDYHTFQDGREKLIEFVELPFL